MFVMLLGSFTYGQTFEFNNCDTTDPVIDLDARREIRNNIILALTGQYGAAVSAAVWDSQVSSHRTTIDGVLNVFAGGTAVGPRVAGTNGDMRSHTDEEFNAYVAFIQQVLDGLYIPESAGFAANDPADPSQWDDVDYDGIIDEGKSWNTKYISYADGLYRQLSYHTYQDNTGMFRHFFRLDDVSDNNVKIEHDTSSEDYIYGTDNEDLDEDLLEWIDSFKCDQVIANGRPCS